MNFKYQIDTKFNHDCIELIEGWLSSDTSVFDQTTPNIVNLREQAVRDALNALGWINPEDAKELRIKAERYEWIKANIDEEVDNGVHPSRAKQLLSTMREQAEKRNVRLLTPEEKKQNALDWLAKMQGEDE